MTTATRKQHRMARNLSQKPFIMDLDGNPAMPPKITGILAYEMPAFKMGTPQRPKSWRIGF